MKARLWLTIWLILVVSGLSIIGFWVYKIDPFFHYHKPELDEYYYPLYNQRSQNDGISKHFDYDAIITGSSMTENFRTSELDRLFGCNSIKVPFSGGTYKEVNDNLKIALSSNNKVRLVVRCLDMSKFLSYWDDMRTDLGKYPLYLYDNNPFNDVEYLFNREIVFGRVYQMAVERKIEGFQPGMTSFDDYSRWQNLRPFGVNEVLPSGIDVKNTEQEKLSDEEKERIRQNIEKNVLSLAESYPNIDFYYYYSPYSVVVWNKWKNEGNILKYLEAEKYITEMILPYKNIHLFSFNTRIDVTSDLNNYKDEAHHASWINSLILKWMHDGKYQLTNENYREVLQKEYELYTSFDYENIICQDDYEDDYYAAALLNNELSGAFPVDVLNDYNGDVQVSGANYIYDAGRKSGIDCKGTLARTTEELTEYIRDVEYIGVKFHVDLDEGYNYLCFDGQKIKDHGKLAVLVYSNTGECLLLKEVNCNELDEQVHHYAVDLSAMDGLVTIVINGGFTAYSGSDESNFQITNIVLY